MASGDNLKEQERTELHNTIWKIANELRGSVDGWDFKAYVLGLEVEIGRASCRERV